jgi:hypothetical protein
MVTSKLLYPEPLGWPLPEVELNASMQKIDEFGTALPMAYRVPLLFNQPARLVVRVSSMIGTDRGWLRAGSLAQVLAELPGDPKKTVKRLYLDEGFFEFDGSGVPFYLEFWPYRWISDYYFELWAQLAPRQIVQIIGSFFTIDGEPFTVDGVGIIL